MRMVETKNGSHCERKLMRILGYVFLGHRWRYIERESTYSLLFMRIARHVHTHLLTLSLSLFTVFLIRCLANSFIVQVLVIVSLAVLLIYMHRQTFTTCSFSIVLLLFFPVEWMTEKTEWDTYVCDNRSLMLLPFFQVFIWQPMRRKEWEIADIDCDQFPLSIDRYNRSTNKKKRKETSSFTREKLTVRE